MKKLLTLTVTLLLSFSILSGCNANQLSDDFDEDTVKAAAEEIVALINADDFDTMLNEKSSEEVIAAITVDRMTDAKKQVMENAGEFQSYKSETVLGEQVDEEDIAVAILIAQYENQDVQYTLSFNKDMQLYGINMK